MQEIAIAWTAWAWVTVWWLGLLFSIVVGPLALLPILSFIVVTIAMLMISFALFRNRWLWPR
jgi:hypothetical protein